MGTRYAILGAGRQGIAAAFDIAQYGGSEQLVLIDNRAEAVATGAQRLAQHGIESRSVVTNGSMLELSSALGDIDVMVAALPYRNLPDVTEIAIQSGTSMVDLGGHTATVLGQLERDSDAVAAKITIVPDCGMGPGLNNTLGLFALERIKSVGGTPIAIHLYDGGLPQDPRPPWGYRLFFHINGLTNEYDGHALFLRNGRVESIPAMTEPEMVEFDGFGSLEAFVTSGGTSTLPYSLKGTLDTYENKTIRYPGHFTQFKSFKDLGLFGEEAVEIPEIGWVTPRTVFHTLLEPQLDAHPIEDVCLMRAVGIGHKDGQQVRFEIDLVDRFDPTTGLAAMERLTGWHAAIMAQLIAGGEVRSGVVKLEEAVSASRFMEEISRRGFEITSRWI